MKSLVVFDSLYGNTQKVAQTIAQALNSQTSSLDAVSPAELSHLTLLIVGSPVHGGHPSPKMQSWLKSIPKGSLKGVKVAAFDTRMDIWIAKLFGYAAPKIEQSLTNCGGKSAASNIGFIVSGKEGPLKPGELDRAITWAKNI
jgi:flavodoxin